MAIQITLGAALVAKSSYTGQSSDVQSDLLYPEQWDSIVKWLNDAGYSSTDSTNWGNYANSTFIVSSGAKYSTTYGDSYIPVTTPKRKESGDSWFLTTGASEQNKAKNIYDFAGNATEWTNEFGGAGARVRRTVDYFNNGNTSVAYRSGGLYDSSGDSGSFRLALYIK